MENCIFCQIVNQTLPGYIISQNEFVTAFLDIHPVSKGHVLVVPNMHVEKLHAVDNPKIVNTLMQALVDTANRIVKAGICTDYSIVQSNGEFAEQDMNHLHFHIIPRHKDDGVVFKLDADADAAQQKNLITVAEQLTI